MFVGAGRQLPSAVRVRPPKLQRLPQQVMMVVVAFRSGQGQQQGLYKAQGSAAWQCKYSLCVVGVSHGLMGSRQQDPIRAPQPKT